jgi:hypothetical protein
LFTDVYVRKGTKTDMEIGPKKIGCRSGKRRYFHGTRSDPWGAGCFVQAAPGQPPVSAFALAKIETCGSMRRTQFALLQYLGDIISWNFKTSEF